MGVGGVGSGFGGAAALHTDDALLVQIINTLSCPFPSSSSPPPVIASPPLPSLFHHLWHHPHRCIHPIGLAFTDAAITLPSPTSPRPPMVNDCLAWSTSHPSHS